MAIGLSDNSVLLMFCGFNILSRDRCREYRCLLGDCGPHQPKNRAFLARNRVSVNPGPTNKLQLQSTDPSNGPHFEPSPAPRHD